jgi:hypothetical protein
VAIESKHSTDVEYLSPPSPSLCTGSRAKAWCLLILAEASFSLRASVTVRVIENKHSTDVESPPPFPRVCMSIHPEGKPGSDIGRVLVLNQSDKISHIDVGDDRIDIVISHIISPYSISISRITISIW